MRRTVLSFALLLVLPVMSPGVAGAALELNPAIPVVASDNIEVMMTVPVAGTAISTAFDPTRPLMYVNTLHGISSFDISDPTFPKLVGELPMPHFENEAMAIGQRANGMTFVLVGLDVFSVTPTDTDEPATESGQHVIVVDVTNAAAPTIIGRLDTGSSTHTVQCVNPECTYAFTSGAYQNDLFHVIDLTNPADPKQVKALPNVAAKAGGGLGGHQWDTDDAGYIWSSGINGVAGYDVTDPLNPKLLASTDPKGKVGSNPYNNFILHNSYRPGGTAFAQTRDEVTGRLVSGSKETATPFAGNVLLATEEDYDNPVCGGDAGEGTFSTWYVPYLDADQYKTDNPNRVPGLGKITPLDNWNSEVLNTGTRTPAGALCSAHYFTYHDAGFIAQGWYQQGTRILDVRNPRDIKQVGYYFTGDTETWHAYWVPERDATGKVTGKDTNIVYTNDVARGIDVLRVTLPTAPPAETTPLTAPILPQWLGPVVASSAPSEKLGYMCRIAGTLRVA